MSRAKQTRNSESGYALLLVFLMAAVIAISLYSEIPRVAFQSQRQKEQLLMERGEQYKRAIQVFMKSNNNQWPRTVDDLVSFQNRHFLRHKYVDPMTGKSEWRVIHIQNGMLTDSVTSKKPGDKDKADASTAGNYIAALPGIGQAPVGGGQGVNLRDRRRQNEGGQGTAGFGGDITTQTSSGAPPSTAPPPNLPGMPPGSNLPGMTPMQPPQQQQAAGGGYIASYSPFGSSPPATPTPTPYNPGIPPGQPGTIINPQTGQPMTPGQVVMPGQTPQPGQPGYPNPQQLPGGPGAPGAPNAATQMIQNILTSPNPRGLAAVQAAQQAGAVNTGGMGSSGVTTAGIASAPGGGIGGAQGGTIGGGVAGVASTAEMEGIMVYNDRTAYNEWEFIFDPTKVPPIPRLGGAGAGNPTSPTSQTQQQNTQFGQRQGGMMPVGGGMQGGMMPVGGGMQGGGIQPAGMQQTGGMGGGAMGGQIQIRMGRP